MRVALLLSLVCVVVLACVGTSDATGAFTQVRSLAKYFDVVLDHNKDGRLTQGEYKHHLEGMDPESSPFLPLSYTNVRHAELDLNRDGVWTARELCLALQICDESEIEDDTWEEIMASNATEPVQLHLAASNVFSAMKIDWAQSYSQAAAAYVQWGTASGVYLYNSPAVWHTYTVSLSGLTYTSLPLFSANMTGLAANTKYFYVVGNSADGFSAENSFTSLPDPSVPPTQQVTTRMVVYGDQGTTIPMGATVCGWVEAENALNPFGLMLHVGDLAYAGVSHSMGEYEPTWDAWMQQIAPIAQSVPYMTSVGNHEDFFNFASYDARFNMPGPESGGNASFWFSFDQGSVHVTSFSSESDYTPTSDQWAWIEADFVRARANPSTVFLVFSGHRPLYSSDTDEYGAHQPGCPLLLALEPLLVKYGVDVVLTGHEHMYERSWPVNNGTVIPASVDEACPKQKDFELPHSQRRQDKGNFWDQVDQSLPLHAFEAGGAPIYIVQATAGVFQVDKVVMPQPVWSAFRLVGTYGYGVLSVSTTASGCSTLLYQFRTVTSTGVVVVDQMVIVKQLSAEDIVLSE